jgi:hypothetical protein
MITIEEGKNYVKSTLDFIIDIYIYISLLRVQFSNSFLEILKNLQNSNVLKRHLMSSFYQRKILFTLFINLNLFLFRFIDI